MSSLEELSRLEKSVLEASKIISKLLRERDKWKTMYEELSGEADLSSEKEIELPEDSAAAVKILEKENRMLKTKIQQVIHQTEELKAEINSRLNQ